MYKVTQNQNLFNLSLNENYFSFCKQQTLNLQNLNRYPNVEIYSQIQTEAQKLYQTSRPILLTNGSDDGIFLIQQHFRKTQNQKIIITNPTFSMYENYAKNLGLDVIKINLDSSLLINLPALILAIQQNPNCLVFIPNPNSPTGTMLSNTQIEELLNQNATIVIDEAYIEFSGKETAIPLLQKHKNLIILRTLSKFYGLAGVRIGFIISNLCNQIKNFQAPFSISSLNAEIALQTLKYLNQNQNEINTFIENFNKEKKEFLQTLIKKKSVIKIYESNANFILLQVSNIENILSNFENQNLLIKNFSPTLPNTIRFSLANTQTNQKILECFF